MQRTGELGVNGRWEDWILMRESLGHHPMLLMILPLNEKMCSGVEALPRQFIFWIAPMPGIRSMVLRPLRSPTRDRLHEGEHGDTWTLWHILLLRDRAWMPCAQVHLDPSHDVPRRASCNTSIAIGRSIHLRTHLNQRRLVAPGRHDAEGLVVVDVFCNHIDSAPKRRCCSAPTVGFDVKTSQKALQSFGSSSRLVSTQRPEPTVTSRTAALRRAECLRGHRIRQPHTSVK